MLREDATIKVSGGIKATFYYSIRIVLLRFCLCTIYDKFSSLHLRYVDDDPTPCPIVTQTRQRIAYVTRSMSDITIINHTLGAPCSHTTFIIYYARTRVLVLEPLRKLCYGHSISPTVFQIITLSGGNEKIQRQISV